jgi:hypothetical protein
MPRTLLLTPFGRSRLSAFYAQNARMPDHLDFSLGALGGVATSKNMLLQPVPAVNPPTRWLRHMITPVLLGRVAGKVFLFSFSLLGKWTSSKRPDIINN